MASASSTSRSAQSLEHSGIYVGSIDDPPEKQGARRVLPSRIGVVYVPPRGSALGWVLFQREQSVYA
jgi:hypothetical protein